MISTVYDLQISICSSENVTDFDQLQVGPLLKMPLVQTLFKLPAGQEAIIEVRCCIFVLMHMTFITRHNKTQRYSVWSGLSDLHTPTGRHLHVMQHVHANCSCDMFMQHA